MMASQNRQSGAEREESGAEVASATDRPASSRATYCRVGRRPMLDVGTLCRGRSRKWLRLAICLIAPSVLVCATEAQAQAPQMESAGDPAARIQAVAETIEVSRIIIDAHVLDADSHLVTKLAPDDLIVRVDGKEARVEAVEWIDERPLQILETDEDGQETRTTEPAPGRLFVYYVQTEFARSWIAKERTLGEMEVIREIRKYIDLLQPNDRVAILQFDSHLKLRLDFTNDHQEVEDAFAKVLSIDDPPPPPPPVPTPSLASLLDQIEARNSFVDR